jgi:hypothetical protein
MSFDPFTNEQIMAVAERDYDLSSPEGLTDYFSIPVKCLLRIAKSIDLWTKDFGMNGYFAFLEQHIGKTVEHNDKMDFTVSLRNRP